MITFLSPEGRRPDARTAIQNIHLQPGIVRQDNAGNAFGGSETALSVAFSVNVTPVSSTGGAWG